MKRVRLSLPFVMLVILSGLLMASMFVLGKAEAAPTTESVSELGISPLSASVPLTIPDGYNTGQWVEVPQGFEKQPASLFTWLLMDGEPVVTMVNTSTAEVAFTTTVPTPAVTVYYGVYEKDALLSPPRFRTFASEVLTAANATTTTHKVTLPHLNILSNEIIENGGGVVAYRIEIYNLGGRHLTFTDEYAGSRFYDRRFEFYNGQLVPTVSEGPFVDQVTENSAIISWDTDMPVNGTVKVGGVGDFPASNPNSTHFEVDLTGLTAGTTYTYTVEITDGSNTTSSKEYYFRTTPQDTTEFTFVVLGDTRATYGGGEYDYNGVSALPLRNLMTHAFNRDPDFIVHTGDLMNGYTTDVTNFNMMLSSFKDIMENVGHYIPIYELMGNHEALFDAYDIPGSGRVYIDKEGDESAEAVFGSHFVNPTNGPTPDNQAAGVPEGKSLPPYEENVYYFDHGNARFVAMNNNYWYMSLPEHIGGNLEGYVLDDQLAWLLQVFEEAKNDSSIDHVFLLAQEPMFPNGGHVKDAMWYHGGDPAHNHGLDRTYVPQRRDEIWRAFIGTGKAVAANFGDEHNYSRTYVTHDKDGNQFEAPAWQIISGAGGSPLAEQDTSVPWADNVEKFTIQMEYTVLRVNGQQVTLEVYNVDDQLIESVVLKNADGTISANARSIEPVKSTPKVLPDTSSQLALPLSRPAPTIEASSALTIPDGYRSGLWPTIPVTYTQYDSSQGFTWLLMDGEPVVTMINTSTAEVAFTTVISTPAATVHYGIYDEATLKWPRFRWSISEPADTYTTQHKITLVGLNDKRLSSQEIAAQGGGVIPYRIEIYNFGVHAPFGREPAAARFYDRRFEFYNGQLVPTVSEGPFVDQVTENSAIISWDSDMSADGTVKIDGVGDFPASNTNSTHFEVAVTGLTAGTTYTYTVELTDGISTTSTPQYYFRTAAQNATQFSFAVMGDSRAAFGGEEHSYNGLNGLAMRNLTRQAFNKNADFIVHTGDLISGYTTSVQNFNMQLGSFKDAVEDVGHYIPIYELMGNHESLLNQYYAVVDGGLDLLWVDKEGEESAEAIFAAHFVNPTNGATPDNAAAQTPAGKSLPPYDENTYYVDHGNSRLVMMNNNYWYSNQPERYGGNPEGYVLDDQFAWLTQVFEEAKNDATIEHVFLFAQEPMFPNGGHTQDAMWYDGGDPSHNHGWDRTYIPQRRDEIWRAFIGTGKAVAANFGDEHNYSRTWITHDKDGNEFETPAWQIISGGAGAPHAEQDTDVPWSANVRKFTTQQHYTLFNVNGSKVMLEVYNLDGQLIEQVELTAEPTSITLTSLNSTTPRGPSLWQLVGLTLVMLGGTFIIRKKRS